MRSGRLRHRITIEQPVQTQDQWGQPITTWSSYREVWAGYEWMRGDEPYQAQQAFGQQAVQFRIRYLSGLTEEMRVQFDGDVYNIRSIQPDPKRAVFQLITATKDLTDG